METVGEKRLSSQNITTHALGGFGNILEGVGKVMKATQHILRKQVNEDGVVLVRERIGWLVCRLRLAHIQSDRPVNYA